MLRLFLPLYVMAVFAQHTSVPQNTILVFKGSVTWLMKDFGEARVVQMLKSLYARLDGI